MLRYDNLMAYPFDGPKLPSLRAWVRFALKNSGMTQIELAEKLGSSANNLSMWINGRQRFPSKYIYRLAKVFNVDPLYLRNIYYYEYCSQDMDIYLKEEEIRHLQWLTENEFEFIKIIRNVGGNPKIENDPQRAMLEMFLKTLPAEGLRTEEVEKSV